MRALSIHLTDICNSKCTFCIVDSPYIKQDTIRRDFLEILDEIREKGYPTVHLMTNARKLARMEFARSVVDKGVSLFVVSMHGATAPTQDRISKSLGSFEQAVQGIRNVKELGAAVRTNSVVCKDNYTELPDIVDLCLDLGADQVNLSALHTSGTALRNFWEVTPRYDEIQPYVLQACERVVRRGARLLMEGFPYCTVPGYERFLVDWEHNRYKVLYRNFVMDDYEDHMDDFTRVKDERCGGCAFNGVCGGVYKEYADLIGWDEFHPVTDNPAGDPVSVG